MKKYIVRFTTVYGDQDKEWCYAHNADEAAQIIKHDHWDIKDINMVTESTD